MELDYKISIAQLPVKKSGSAGSVCIYGYWGIFRGSGHDAVMQRERDGFREADRWGVLFSPRCVRRLKDGPYGPRRNPAEVQLGQSSSERPIWEGVFA
jgi:hypothetical protein